MGLCALSTWEKDVTEAGGTVKTDPAEGLPALNCQILWQLLCWAPPQPRHTWNQEAFETKALWEPSSILEQVHLSRAISFFLCLLSHLSNIQRAPTRQACKSHSLSWGNARSIRANRKSAQILQCKLPRGHGLKNSLRARGGRGRGSCSNQRNQGSPWARGDMGWALKDTIREFKTQTRWQVGTPGRERAKTQGWGSAFWTRKCGQILSKQREIRSEHQAMEPIRIVTANICWDFLCAFLVCCTHQPISPSQKSGEAGDSLQSV